MTFRTATIAAFSIFTIACADESNAPIDSDTERAELPTGLDGIGNSTDGDGSIDEDEVITPDDVPRLVQSLMEDIYASGEDCLPGATIMGTFTEGTVTGKALDPFWRIAATFDGDLAEDGSWDADWTGVSDEEVDPNNPEEIVVETGEIEGDTSSEDESFTGTIYMSETISMDIEGYWVHLSDIAGFFFGVAWDCE